MADTTTSPGEADRPGGVGEPLTTTGPYEIRFWHNGQIVYRFESDTFVEFTDQAVIYPDKPASPDQPAA